MISLKFRICKHFKMKKAILLLIIMLPFYAISQNYDDKLEEIAKNVAQTLNEKQVAKVAVWKFISNKQGNEEFSNYITEDFSIYLANHAKNFGIIDRLHLKSILKEHRLNAQGYIDENTAKQLGKIIAADAVIVGSYSVSNSEIRVRVKVLDTETALQWAGTMGNLQMTNEAARMLGKL